LGSIYKYISKKTVKWEQENRYKMVSINIQYKSATP
jgi:hypothetical protein